MLTTTKPDQHPELYWLVNDARLFLLSFKSVIKEAPLQAYHSAIVFSPASSIIRNRFLQSYDSADSVSTRIKILPEVEDWNLSVQACKQALEGHTDFIWTVAFSNDGLLASGTHDNTVRVWDPMTGDCKKVLKGQLPPEFSTLSNLQFPLYSLNGAGKWVTRNNRHLLLLPDDHHPDCFAVKGNTLAIAHRSGQITFLEFSSDIDSLKI
jgi:WD40 repeat protein